MAIATVPCRCGKQIHPCTCGGTACPGWCHVGRAEGHWCGNKPEDGKAKPANVSS
jgi:hypothetical protein